MGKIEQLVELYMEIEHLKRKMEGNISECFFRDEDYTSTNKTMNKALLLI